MNNLRISEEIVAIDNPTYGNSTETKFHVCKDFKSNGLQYSSSLLKRGDIVETFSKKVNAKIFLDALTRNIKEVILNFNNKEVTSEQWHEIRHYDQTKSMSMLGKFNENNKVKYSVIFKDKTEMFVYL